MGAEYDDTTVPYSPTTANYQRRLINFNTGKFDLLYGHRNWLDDLIKGTPATREFYCDIYGYASKLGDAGKNEKLAYNRANTVAKYLEERDPKYTTRIRTFRTFGENDPNYRAGERDNDGRWRAVEVHCQFDSPPRLKPGAIQLPKPTPRTHMKWSCCGYFGLMASVMNVAQYGFSLFKFRDDETGTVRTYLAPMFGVGIGLDITKILGFLKGLGDKKIPGWAHLEHAIDKVLSTPSLLANPYAALKEIGNALLTGASLQDWTDFSKCEVLQPLTHEKLNGATVANASATGAVYQSQRVWVYGKVWYREKSGGKMFGTRDLLSVDSTGWVAQVPALAASGVGGPLILL